MSTTEPSEHIATNKEVAKAVVEVKQSNKDWGITQIAAILVALSTIAALLTGFWSTAVEAGGKGKFATVEQVAAVTERVSTLDAGNTAAMEKVRVQMEQVRQEQKADVQRVEKKVDRLIDLMLKEKGGK